MKVMIALISLLAATSASANTLAVQLVPCTNSEMMCGIVLQDLTTKQKITNPVEMDIVSDGVVRNQIWGIVNASIAAKKALPVIAIEGRMFQVFSGATMRIKADNIAPLK